MNLRPFRFPNLDQVVKCNLMRFVQAILALSVQQARKDQPVSGVFQDYQVLLASKVHPYTE